jgi:hypothetical protein
MPGGEQFFKFNLKIGLDRSKYCTGGDALRRGRSATLKNSADEAGGLFYIFRAVAVWQWQRVSSQRLTFWVYLLSMGKAGSHQPSPLPLLSPTSLLPKNALYNHDEGDI